MDYSVISNLFLSLITLTFLELVLGIDNIIFISLLTERLKANQRTHIRRLGLMLALLTRLLFLGSVLWLVGFTKPLFELIGHSFSGRDLILLGGGLFLLFKSTHEIHNEFEIEIGTSDIQKFTNPFLAIIQIAILDLVFSLDSIITAIGLTQNFMIMAVAILIAILGMIYLSDMLSKLIHEHPTIKMLALSFLLLIGTILVADGFGYSIPRGYVYFSICFAVFVELMNNLVKHKKRKKKR